jgi:hypothetical protein
MLSGVTSICRHDRVAKHLSRNRKQKQTYSNFVSTANSQCPIFRPPHKKAKQGHTKLSQLKTHCASVSTDKSRCPTSPPPFTKLATRAPASGCGQTLEGPNLRRNVPSGLGLRKASASARVKKPATQGSSLSQASLNRGLERVSATGYSQCHRRSNSRRLQ